MRSCSGNWQMAEVCWLNQMRLNCGWIFRRLARRSKAFKEITMATATIDEERLKTLLKSALGEALEEHRDLVREIVEESLEEIVLSKAIKQGLKSPPVSRDQVFAILEDRR